MTDLTPLLRPAHEIAADVAARRVSAREMAELALAAIARMNPRLNAFTDVTAERALAEAEAVDRKVAGGAALPLAGVPYGAKNLFDIAGLTTRAGSKINRIDPPAKADAFLIERMQAAGGLLLGGLNMGEYAYDFTGENAHDGASLNPHDPSRMSGGSSGGSGTAVASGMVAAGLCSDTNGSIRVPASFCGLFGLKPTFGRLSRGRTFPFVASLDHLGPLARSAKDLALLFEALQGADPDDPAQARRGYLPVLDELDRGIDGLRIARAGGYFEHEEEKASAAVDQLLAPFPGVPTITLPEAALARAAAYVITATEASAFHLGRVRERAADFDPEVRDRLISGAMIPAAWYVKAQRFRAWFRAQMLEIFRDVDLIVAPATPFQALKSGTRTVHLHGAEMPARPNIGVYTQPISFIGLPVVSVPVWLKGDTLPIGVQLIAPPWREDIALRFAWHLEREGLTAAPVAPWKDDARDAP